MLPLLEVSILSPESAAPELKNLPVEHLPYVSAEHITAQQAAYNDIALTWSFSLVYLRAAIMSCKHCLSIVGQDVKSCLPHL